MIRSANCNCRPFAAAVYVPKVPLVCTPAALNVAAVPTLSELSVIEHVVRFHA